MEKLVWITGVYQGRLALHRRCVGSKYKLIYALKCQGPVESLDCKIPQLAKLFCRQLINIAKILIFSEKFEADQRLLPFFKNYPEIDVYIYRRLNTIMGVNGDC